jgi:hypothetical protein
VLPLAYVQRRWQPAASPARSREGVRKKFQNFGELGSNRAMTAIHAIGPFGLDAEAELAIL